MLVLGIVAAFIIGLACGILKEKLGRFGLSFSQHGCITSISWKPFSERFPCDQLFKASAKENSPFHFDPKTCEFEVRMDPTNSKRGAWPLYFCPFTGRPLGSGRSFLFTQPTESETRRIYGLIEDVRTVDDLIKKLGKPDFSVGKTDYMASAFTYTNLSQEADLIIVQELNGHLSPCVAGKLIRNTVMKIDSNNGVEPTR